MNKVIRVLVVLAAILFIVNGVRWLVNPSGIVGMFGFELSKGLGLSSQIGDMSAYFLTLGICMLMGVVANKSLWFYPAMMLLALTAMGRILAWLVHDAAFATGLIIPEILISLLLWFAASRLGKAE
ncbi:MAG: hypothetical protein ACI9SX_000914 [Pseudoalteromonas tetraodonis]|jgi:hypothetical protein